MFPVTIPSAPAAISSFAIVPVVIPPPTIIGIFTNLLTY
jgi:hypothetical protein